MRGVYYALTFSNDEDMNRRLVFQLENSLRTLRRHNTDVEVLVCVFNGDIAELVKKYGATALELGTYARALHKHCDVGMPALALYPALPKWLALEALTPFNLDSLLYVDCDTHFFRDVAQLFECYGEAHLYSREEIMSRSSHFGYNSEYLDEDALEAVAIAENARLIPPLNTGVVMFNHGTAQKLVPELPALMSYVVRFFLWLDDNRGRHDLERIEPALKCLPARADRNSMGTALAYPSANTWICEELAINLTLGRMAGVTTDFFRRDHVLQGGEFGLRNISISDVVVCHYYTGLMDRFFNWISRR